MTHITKSQIKLVRSLMHKKYRDEHGLFIAEGDKCVNELLKRYKPYLLLDSSNCSSAEIEQMSNMRSPQGVIGVFHIPSNTAPMTLAALTEEDNIILVLDGIQDPGNLGTIIRTCDWFGVQHIICSADTADCYNPKVVQATMGALANVNIHYVSDLLTLLQDLQLAQRGSTAHIIGTLLNGNAMYECLPKTITSKTWQDKTPVIVVMGNEGKGISQPIQELVTLPICIPPYPKDTSHTDSLNVATATAICLAELRRLQSLA